jgi:hypothetical protein
MIIPDKLFGTYKRDYRHPFTSFVSNAIDL